jgi:hypothetical protein
MGHHLDSAARPSRIVDRSHGSRWSGLAVVAGVVAGFVLMVTILSAIGLGRCTSIVDGIRVGHMLMSSRCE